MNHYVLGFVLLLSFAWKCCSSDETLGKVIFANVLYRHGARTPIESYPNDPYKNQSLWPEPFGQLTNLGKRQHLLLGRWLRDRYAHLISPTYTADDIYVISTDVDRTLMSAEVNLAGMYPPSGDQVWDIENWIPIPVHTIPAKYDDVLAVKKYCEKYSREFRRVLDSPEWKKIGEDNAELYEYLSEHTGKKINSLGAVGFLYGTLYVEELDNKTLPAWTEDVYPKVLRSLTEKNFELGAYNKILQRLKSGPLLKDMIEHMKLKSKNALRPNRKLWVYSAHDFTIVNMMMTLGVFEPHCPPFAATLLIELRIDVQNDYVVTIFYKNSTEEPTLLTLPGCVDACPLDQFIKLTSDVIPDNWERECAIDVDVVYLKNTDFEIIPAMLLTAAFFFSMWLMMKAYYLACCSLEKDVKKLKHKCHQTIELAVTDSSKTSCTTLESKDKPSSSS